MDQRGEGEPNPLNQQEDHRQRRTSGRKRKGVERLGTNQPLAADTATQPNAKKKTRTRNSAPKPQNSRAPAASKTSSSRPPSLTPLQKALSTLKEDDEIVLEDLTRSTSAIPVAPRSGLVIEKTAKTVRVSDMLAL